MTILKNLFVAVGVAIVAQNVTAQELYLDQTAPTEQRVRDLLDRMTIDEKISLLIASSPGIERLGVSKYYHGNEALHGIVRPGHFTVFPQAIGMAATWNPGLIYQVSTAISDEARARWNELNQGEDQTDPFTDLLTFWSPTVNMARDPRWGRTPETYGEDPYLTGMIGTAFVRGLQGDDPRYLKVVSTPKHFAVNNEEHNRFECDAQVSEKQLREYYLPAFEMCVREGHCRSIMSAYNAINGVPCTANPWLLDKVLRHDWGFDGYVVSDCGAPSLLISGHKYVKTKEAAAALSLKAGLDLECGDNIYMEPLKKAFEQWMVTEAEIDSAAYRVLKARFDFGMFDDPAGNPYAQIPPEVIGCDKHQQIALETARQSIVLLKNDKNFLPLNPKKIKSIAVVGINADNAEFGDYSGMPVIAPVSVLKGLQQRVGDDVRVVYAPWKSAADGMELIQGENFPEGVKAEYFTNMNLEGTPAVRTEPWINFEPANQPPDPFVPMYYFSARWSGKLRPNVSGEYTLCLTSDEGARLRLDDEMLIDAWAGHSVRQDSVRVYLEADRDYNLAVEYKESRDFSIARLQWRLPAVEQATLLDLYGDAGRAVKECDLVVAVMGNNKTIEREGHDRSNISLAADQQRFLEEIYKVNPNMVVVLLAGSPMDIGWLDEHVPAIVDAWYPGESGGTAVTEVLFGDYNPAGRVPLTWYRSVDDLPAFDDYDISKGRTYQYFEGDVLYPFGYGMSYTKFGYSGLKLTDKGDIVEVTFTLKNTGKRAGDEVAQVYVRLPERNELQPLRELKGFERVSLGKGERRQVTIPVRKDLLRYWDEERAEFVTPEGAYTFFVGGDSSNTPLSGVIEL